MKKVIVLVVGVLLAGASSYNLFQKSPREEYAEFLREHPYKKMLTEGASQKSKEKESDRPDLARMQDFLRTMDPSLKRPTPEVMSALSVELARQRDSKNISSRTTATSLADATVWEERGPQDVGGRTRAILFDPSDANRKKVWAGGVSGGLWFNNDITDANSSWQKVDDLWDNLAISCIAADPNNSQVMYVGTGEGWFNLDLVIGAGIWKTTDGGTTWNQLPSTSTYMFVNDIVVRNESGTSVLYAAVQGSNYNGFSSSSHGLFRSINGGTSWTQVLPASIDDRNPTDIELGKDNKIYVGAKVRFSTGQSTIYLSTTGTTWTTTSTSFSEDGRVEIACAPSDELIAYAILEDANKVGGIYKTANGGTSWSPIDTPVDADDGIPANDFSRDQAWYDLTIAVHPSNANTVIVGTIDLFRSTDAGSNWTQISKWHGGIATTAPVVHADQHQIIFRPDFPNEAVFGTDGGIYYSTNVTAATSSLSITVRNSDYNVTQFYTGAIHPTSTNYLLGGTQDNGTLKFTNAGFGTTTEANGGDGAMCFIDQVDPSFQIVSYVYNDISLSTNGGTSFNIPLIEDQTTGNFINNGDYDSKLKILFTALDDQSIYRVKNVSLSSRSVDQVAVNLGSIASAMRISPFAPSGQSNLYVGTEAGKVLKIINAQNASPTITEITGPSFPAGSVSCIAFGVDENQILVTFSNYGVTNIWETRNGGGTWVSREGNLPNMPVRWAEYHPLFFDQVYIATEMGVWSTDDINVTNPVWNSTNGGLANVRTDMLRVRESDKVIMAATHGRGVFTALIPSELDQTITFGALPMKAYGDASFQLTATSTSGLPVSFASSNTAVATVSGSAVTIVGAGTTSITATQAGNVQYKSADPVSQTLTVQSRIIKITGTLEFGDVIIDEEKALTFLVENAGDVPITISSITYPSGYSGTQTSGANNTTTVTVTFAPTDVIDYDGEIVVNNNGSGNNKIAVSGTGIKITALGDSNLAEEIKIFPNPASEKITIQSKWLKNTSSLSVINLSGKEWKQTVSPLDEHSVQMDVTSLSTGTYIVRIPAGKSYQFKKFIKQ